ASCTVGRLEGGVCKTEAEAPLECPEGFTSTCDAKSAPVSKCCLQHQIEDAQFVCPDGTTEATDGRCKRLTRFTPTYECPAGFLYEDGYCSRKEPGNLVTSCGVRGRLTADNTCLTTVPASVVYECPQGYQCADAGQKHGFCTECVRREITPVSCGCDFGAVEVNGACYKEEDARKCKGDKEWKKMLDALETDNDFNAADSKKEPCGADAPKCRCQPGAYLECKKGECVCVTEDITAVVPRCLDHTDASGDCVKEVKSAPSYQCDEGQECEIVGKKNECQCVQKYRTEYTLSCGAGVLIDGDCFAVDYLSKTYSCPPTFNVVCKGTNCECQRSVYAARIASCNDSQVFSKKCKATAAPEFACKKVRTISCYLSESMTPSYLRQGELVDGNCVKKHYAVQICDA
ncbi:oocyst wall protein, partial [Cystoisospora suis]